MTNEEKINEILQDHEKRITKLESLIFKNKQLKIQEHKKSLTDYILYLRDKGFFSQSRTADETQKKLRGIYHCEEDRISMALLRLAKKKHLRKASKDIDGKKYKAYVW